MTVTLVSGLTVITDCESGDSSYWVEGGGGNSSQQNGYQFVNGSNGRSKLIDDTTSQFGFDYYAKNSATVDLSSTHVWIWFHCMYGELITSVSIRISSDTTGDITSDYKEWAVISSVEKYNGGWHRLVVDTTKTATASSGSPNLSASAIVGISVVMQNFPGFSHNVFIDGIHYGTTLVVRAGSASVAHVWDDIVAEDTGGTSKPNYGFMIKKEGVIHCLGTIQLGESTGSEYCRIEDSNAVLLWEERKLSGGTTALGSSFNQLKTVSGATGNVQITDGVKSGSGDSALGYAGSTFMGDLDGGVCQFTIDFSDGDADHVKLYGTRIENVTEGVSFPSSGNYASFELTGCIFNQCGQVDVGRVPTRGCSFMTTKDQSSDGSALLWNSDIDIKNCRFTVNTDSANDPHAIEHPAAGTFNYDNLWFSRNDYDIEFSASSGTLTVNNLNGSNASTYEITGSGTSVTINTAVNITIYVKDVGGTAISSAQTAVFKASDMTQLMNEDTDGTGKAEEAFNYTSDTNVIIRVRKSSTGATRYIPFSGIGTITSSGLTLTVTLIEDKNTV